MYIAQIKDKHGIKERKSHSVEVQNGTLTVNVINDKNWHEYIEFAIGSPKIMVYLSEAEYSSLVIEESTGDITLEGSDATRKIARGA